MLSPIWKLCGCGIALLVMVCLTCKTYLMFHQSANKKGKPFDFPFKGFNLYLIRLFNSFLIALAVSPFQVLAFERK
jgi:hypothetical protein